MQEIIRIYSFGFPWVPHLGVVCSLDHGVLLVLYHMGQANEIESRKEQDVVGLCLQRNEQEKDTLVLGTLCITCFSFFLSFPQMHPIPDFPFPARNGRHSFSFPTSVFLLLKTNLPPTGL
jgi:hypothetical protein